MSRLLHFPDGFVWGAATSSYQIEGAINADGRGESIWDRFCTQRGAIADGSSGAVACDHYHRWADDIALMSSLNLGAYRFSIAWPRVIPTGVGVVNHAGLDFYDRLVDGLLAKGIRPFATLYHWDLPQVLEDAGGWPARATAEAFADYAEVVATRLGDRVQHWATINEPFVVANHGYLTGEHAPGRSSLRDSLAAAHHVLLGHGLAVERLRAVAPAAKVGIVLNFTPKELAVDSPAARYRLQLQDDLENRWYLDPVAGRGYPEFATEQLAWDQSEIHPGDLDLIGAPLDFLGVNFYTRGLVGSIDGEAVTFPGAATEMGWEIHPPSLGSLLRRLGTYDFPEIYITENGAAMPDAERAEDGRVADGDRQAYYADHLAEVHGAIADGVPMAGYFAWSLLDNFEWGHGYRPRFGMVEVDYATQRRTPKQSALWYAGVARANAVPR